MEKMLKYLNKVHYFKKLDVKRKKKEDEEEYNK
jgi:hypothetical protein